MWHFSTYKNVSLGKVCALQMPRIVNICITTVVVSFSAHSFIHIGYCYYCFIFVDDYCIYCVCMLMFRGVHCLTAPEAQWSIAAPAYRPCIPASSISEVFFQTSLASNTGLTCFLCITDITAVKLEMLSCLFRNVNHIFSLFSSDQFVTCNLIAGKTFMLQLFELWYHYIVIVI